MMRLPHDGFIKTYIWLLTQPSTWIATIIHKAMLVLILVHTVSSVGFLFSKPTNEPLMSWTFLEGSTNTPVDKTVCGIGLYLFLVLVLTLGALAQCWPKVLRDRHQDYQDYLRNNPQITIGPQVEAVEIFGPFEFLSELKCEGKKDSNEQ